MTEREVMLAEVTAALTAPKNTTFCEGTAEKFEPWIVTGEPTGAGFGAIESSVGICAGAVKARQSVASAAHLNTFIVDILRGSEHGSPQQRRVRVSWSNGLMNLRLPRLMVLVPDH